MSSRNTVRAYNLNIHADFELDLPLASGQPDLSISQQYFEHPQCEKTKIFRAGQQAQFAHKNKAYYLIWPTLVAFKITQNHIYYHKLTSQLPTGLLRVMALSEALGIVLFLRGHVLLHASAVLIHNRAGVFLGTPGAGKSTTVAAYAKYGHLILSDDIVAISIPPGEEPPELIPGFAEIKIWQDTARALHLNVESLTPAWEGKNKYIYKTSPFPISPRAYKLKNISILIDMPSDKQNSENLSLEEKYMALIQYFPLPHQLLAPLSHKGYFGKLMQVIAQTTLVKTKRAKTIEDLEKNIKKLTGPPTHA